VRLPDQISADELKTAAIVLVAAFVIASIVAMRYVQKMVFRVLILVALVGVGVFLYTQREDLDKCQKQLRQSDGQLCVCDFAGLSVTVPPCKTKLLGG